MKGESECDCVKKIGILTFHKSINYGSVLQAFALSDLLSKRGYAVEIIDYEPASYSIQYRIFEKNTSVHNVAANIRRLSVFENSCGDEARVNLQALNGRCSSRNFSNPFFCFHRISKTDNLTFQQNLRE